MRKGQYPWFLIIILIIGYAGFHLIGLVLAGIGLFLGYYFSVRRHPRIRHIGWRSCNGTGERRGSFFTWTFHRCPDCGGGRLIRWGAGHFGTTPVKAEYRRGIEARRRAREQARWR